MLEFCAFEEALFCGSEALAPTVMGGNGTTCDEVALASRCCIFFKMRFFIFVIFLVIYQKRRKYDVRCAPECVNDFWMNLASKDKIIFMGWFIGI